MSISDNELQSVIGSNVATALHEDLGSGDLTASLLPADATASARVITREAMVLCGKLWFDEVFRQIDPATTIRWFVSDAAVTQPGDTLCELRGLARSLVIGERCALNFLQLLSGTATTVATYVAAVAGTSTKILDTRKTVPGLRAAQKYAVRCGGGMNHRFGLFDAILIKENHVLASGGIGRAVNAARQIRGNYPVEVEVESLDELREALDANAERILLDNFPLAELAQAVQLNRNGNHRPAELEASGGISLETIRSIAETGVDYISVGSLTKNVRAVDLSMRFE